MGITVRSRHDAYRRLDLAPPSPRLYRAVPPYLRLLMRLSSVFIDMLMALGLTGLLSEFPAITWMALFHARGAAWDASGSAFS